MDIKLSIKLSMKVKYYQEAETLNFKVHYPTKVYCQDTMITLTIDKYNKTCIIHVTVYIPSTSTPIEVQHE